MSTFTDDQILLMRTDRRTSREVAADIGCAPSTVRAYRSGAIPDGPWPPEKDIPDWSGHVGPAYGKKNGSAVLTAPAVLWLKIQRARKPKPPPWRVLLPIVAEKFNLERVPSYRAARKAVADETWSEALRAGDPG